MMQTLRSVTHAHHLLTKVSGLIDGQTKFSDVQVTVGHKTFSCHSLVLALRSPYFEQKLFAVPVTPAQITIYGVYQEDFVSVLQYVYKGQIDIRCQNVENVYRAADTFQLVELKQMCLDYAVRTLSADNCTRYWKLAEMAREPQFAQACKDIYLREFKKLSSMSDLCHVSEEMLKSAFRDDGLHIGREVDVLEVMMKWLAIQWDNGLSVGTRDLLQTVRWSDVPEEYIRSNLLTDDNLIRDRACYEFLTNIVNYHLTGVQFDGLCTFHRPSAGQEICLVTVGSSVGEGVESDVHTVSLQRPDVLTRVQDIPGQVQHEAVACVNQNMVYVTGVGPALNETWIWTIISGWMRCGDLNEGRCRHCATFVNQGEMYVLGGFDGQNVVHSVEKFTKNTNRWKGVGELSRATMSAAWVAHRTSIFVFGGSEHQHNLLARKATPIDCIQIYDTATNACTVLKHGLPKPERYLRAVTWDKSAILISDRTCLVFDLKQQTFRKRKQFAVGLKHFGVVLENQNVYVIGGGRDKREKDGRTTWSLSDEVMRVPVTDIINNQTTANWIQHARLPRPSLVHAFAVVSLSTD